MEIPTEGAKYSSRYEIYNSTTKPFGRSYRELTLSSSASGISSCESHTSSISSSGLSETTTYITCSSEIEPVQMTGFHCIDESSRTHTVSIFNDDGYEVVREETNYDLAAPTSDNKGESDECASEKEIVADRKSFSGGDVATTPDCDASPATGKTRLVNIETWSNGTASDEPLKSPKLLKQMISNYEDRQLQYEMPKSSTRTTYAEDEYTYDPRLKAASTKTVTKCRSLLNLDLKPESLPPTAEAVLPKATSEANLVTEKELEKQRITKTISLMLENRRRQTPPAAPIKSEEKAVANGVINADLVNDNVELVEPRRAPQTLDRTCRVTGEILKNNRSPTIGSYADYHRNVYTLPRSLKSHRAQLQRHFYYPQYAAKSSTRVLDEELPDPDKVKSARELFERVLKIGSLENVNRAKSPPKREFGVRTTPEIRTPAHAKLQKSLSVDTSHMQHSCGWMDNGSVSSGVGSDISVETDLELSPRGPSGSDCGSKEDAIFTSEEDLSTSKEVAEDFGKPISPDVLSNIRAYGTSVTYYGGKIIASSKGYACSPMTMTIMNEIKQSSPDYHANRKFLFDDKQIAKFKLIKSNSCGSRLELSGTDEYGREYDRRVCNLRDDCNAGETKRETDTIKEEDEDEQAKKVETWPKTKEAIGMFETKGDKAGGKNWLQYNVKPKENGNPHCDMEFEEFEVLEEKS